MKALVKELRELRKKYEEKAKKVEHKSDPSDRERYYGTSEGILKAIEMIEEEGDDISRGFKLLLTESIDEEWMDLGINIEMGKPFHLKWLNPQKIAESFLFKLEEIQ